MKKNLLLCLVLVALVLGGCVTPPTPKMNVAGVKEFTGKAQVVDGDTIFVRDADGRHKVRLASIDAPELKQPFGPEAKVYLVKKIDGKDVRVTWTMLDKYGRAIGNVYYGSNQWANIEMVAGGYAWQYTAYSNDPNMAKLEAVVKARKLGLWSQPNPVPPWEFRKQKD